jgi:hypothetical protein
VPRDNINQMLDRLDSAKRQFGTRRHLEVERLLTKLSAHKIKDAESLIRYHEILLFARAYPQGAGVLRLAEKELKSFGRRVEMLKTLDVDLSPLASPEVSGITNTSVTDTFSYNIVRWLAKKHPGQIAFDWEWFEDESRLAESWPRFLPLLEEDAAVEANVPYRKWLSEACGRGRETSWLIQRFESLSLTDLQKGEIYNSLKLYVRWQPAYRATRTGMRLLLRSVFFHREPPIRRQDVSLADELLAPAAPIRKLSRSQGEKILDIARETSTLRYRELYGFTHGDPAQVLKTGIGRGVELFIAGLPPGKRLPLRAYHAAMIFKNGVPVGYFEGISLFERMESGFNFYYSFREGETAWIYAKTLAVFHHLLGVTAFSIDPYQIGYENEEGIESGAFWFYRKLGFRPTNPNLLKLALAEEKKIATRRDYRTRPEILRRLAENYLIFELPPRAPSAATNGGWDRFHIRNLGLAVQRRMAKEFGGESAAIRKASLQAVAQAVGVRIDAGKKSEARVWNDLSLVLALIPDLDRWSADDKRTLVRIIQAKARADESQYLRLMQRHHRLRAEMIRLGSENA